MKRATFPSLLGASVAINESHGADVAPLILQQSIPLPDVKEKFDHVAIDSWPASLHARKSQRHTRSR